MHYARKGKQLLRLAFESHQTTKLLERYKTAR